MIITEIEEKSIWEDFFLKHEEKTFLQSWNWGEFQKEMGNKIWRLGVSDNNGRPTSIMLVVKVVARRGTFLLVQHNLGLSEIILNKLKKIAKEERCAFIRMAPLMFRTEENKKIFRDLGFRESPMHASAYEATWKLDVTISEEELLKNMRKSTRYLIHQALKNQALEITKTDKADDVIFYDKLNREVAKHQQFVPFSYEFVRNEFESFIKDGQSLLFFGKYQGEIIASALVIFWSGVGFYHQAALDPKYHKIPIAYLLQWEAIKEAKRRGCKFYDFWGYVDPKSRHPWAGPTLFKMGFGGKSYEYIKTQDLPLSKSYWLTYAFETLRKLKRGL
ncbi:MAG: peptidoglycan bridge formation glycyltransferase FemA/FemB family protein [Candidatus Nealsonbacteria bacterium]